MKPGFVYIWFDSFRVGFYIGSHRGKIDDGYISSSVLLNRAYSKRPNNFKRRILFYVDSISSQDIRAKEQKWLDLVKVEELGTKYYNLKKKAAGGNGGANKGQRRDDGMKAKLRLANLGKKQTPEIIAKRIAHRIGVKRPPFSNNHKEKIRAALTGKKQPAELVAKRAAALTGRKRPPFSEEHKAKLRAILDRGRNSHLLLGKTSHNSGGI